MFLLCIKGWKKEILFSNLILFYLFCLYNLMVFFYNCDVMFYLGFVAYFGFDVGEGEIIGGLYYLVRR